MGIGFGIDFSNIGVGPGVNAGNPASVLPAYGGVAPTVSAPSTTEVTANLPPGYTPSGVIPSTGGSTVTPSSQSTIGGILSSIGNALNPSSVPVVGSGAPNVTTVSAPVQASPLASPIVWLGALIIIGAGAYLLLKKKR